jgi:EmrB/QacA subfamily drug resistance transporter
MKTDEIYARRWWTLAALCFSLLIIGMDTTILNVALPTLARDLHAGTSSLQWMVDAYVLVYASMLLTTGSMGDRFGRKGALSVGLLIFGAGSLASAFSGSANTLIACRAVMGLGGCLIMPATLSILTNVFPKDERAKAIGIWAGVSGLGIVAGPTLGGLLLLHFWWGSVFLINVPVVVVALVAGHFLVPTSRDPASPRLDPVGTALSIVGLTLVLYSIIEAPTKGLASAGVLGVFGIGLVVVVLFALWELHTDHPMLDVRFFENPRFSAASVTITLAFFAMTGLLFFLTQYMQSVLGYSPLQSGFALIPVAITMMVSSLASARLDARFGSKAVVVTGMVIAAGAVGLLANAQATSPYALIAAVVALLGLGLGCVMTPATNSIMGSLPLAKAGVGSAVNDTTRQIGGALGVAILGSITNAVYRSSVQATSSFRSLPAAAQTTVRAGIGNVAIVKAALPAGGAQLAREAGRAFAHAMNLTALIGAAFMLLGALIAFRWLPAHHADEVEPVQLVAIAPGGPEPMGLEGNREGAEPMGAVAPVPAGDA